MADAFLAGIDEAEAEDLAARFIAAVLAVVEFARPDDEFGRADVFEAAIAIGLVEALAAWVAHDHQDKEQHEAALEWVIQRLRAKVAEHGAAL